MINETNKAMKIIRKQFIGDIISGDQKVIKTVVKMSADNQDWRKLVEKCRDKCAYSKYGIPYMTVWKNKVSLETKTGHNFQFELIKQ